MGATAVADAADLLGGEEGFIVLEPGEDEGNRLLDGDGVTGAFDRGFLDEVAGAFFAEVREGLGKDSDFGPFGGFRADVESPESAAVDELEEVVFVEVEQVFGGFDGEQRETRRGDAERERELLPIADWRFLILDCGDHLRGQAVKAARRMRADQMRVRARGIMNLTGFLGGVPTLCIAKLRHAGAWGCGAMRCHC